MGENIMIQRKHSPHIYKTPEIQESCKQFFLLYLHACFCILLQLLYSLFMIFYLFLYVFYIFLKQEMKSEINYSNSKQIVFHQMPRTCNSMRLCILSHFSHVHFFCDPMDLSQPGSSVHWILQAGIQKWAAMPSSRGSF